MEGLNNFGLTIGTGYTGSALALSDVLRALRVEGGQAADAGFIAKRLVEELDFGSRPFARLLDELTGPADPNAALASEVVTRLGTSGLTASLLKLEVVERKRASSAAARSLTASALVTVIQAMAATLSIQLSQPLLQLVQKLATVSEGMSGLARDRADKSYRGLVDHLVQRWSESQLSRGSGGFDAMFMNEVHVRSSIAPEPSRVIALSLESGAVGTVLWSAVKEQSLTEEGVRTLIEMISQAEDSKSKRALIEQISTPMRLTKLLRESEIDYKAVDMMIGHLGAQAARPLIDELVGAAGRGTRRALMDRLVTLGPDIAPLILERLLDQRWFVVRNMISLLRETDAQVDPAQLDEFVTHADARVRREVLQLRMDDPATVDEALLTALKDRDKSVVRIALQAARTTFPPEAVTLLAKRVLAADFPPEFRVMSLYLLGRTEDTAARDALLAYASSGKSMFGKVKLAHTSPEMLAALSGLARSWSDDPKARDVIAAAEKSKDVEILNALRTLPGGES